MIHFKQGLFCFIILVATGGFFFFYRLGGLSLLDPDEPRYAEVAREMLERNDFIIPYLNYQPRLKKPPLFYWLIVISYRLFGINEFSARFFSALSGFLGVILTYLMGSLLYNHTVGFFSSLILMTSLEYLIVSRLAITDMVLCFFFLSSLFCFLKYKKERKDIFLFFFWLSLAFSFLNKGPIGLLPLLVIIIYALFDKDFLTLKDLFLKRVSFLIFFFILGFPWYLILAFKFGFSDMLNLFRYETLERFVKGYIHREPFFYFFPILLLGFFPWTSFLLWRKVELKKDKFLIIWFLTVFLFFSLCSSKIPTYIISLFPCLSIFLADFWKNLFSKELNYPARKIFLSTLILFVFLISSIFWANFFLKEEKSLEINIFSPLLIGTIFFIFSLIFTFSRKFKLLFLTIFSLPLVSLCLFYSFFAYQLSNFRSTKSLISPVKEEIKEKDLLIAYNFQKPSLVFYTQRKVIFLKDFIELNNYLKNEKNSIWLVIKEEDYPLLHEYNLSLKNKVNNFLVLKTGF